MQMQVADKANRIRRPRHLTPALPGALCAHACCLPVCVCVLQIEVLREQYETGQEGWRAAMAERARKEVAERTAAIRDKLMHERNEEIEVCG